MRRDAAAAAAGGDSPHLAVDVKEAGEKEKGEVVIDVESPAAEAATASSLVCRICHLSPERDGFGSGSEVIRLGCGCKDELGGAHRHCAEAWFRVKGDRCCEICGSDAKNITGLEVRKFMEEWHGRRVTITRSAQERESCWRQQPFCNFLLACLVIAFMLPWFFRVNMF